MSLPAVENYLFGLFNIMSAAITPGTQPHIHNTKTIIIEPQPLPITDNGGKKTARITRQILIILVVFFSLTIHIRPHSQPFVTYIDF